MVSTFTPNLGLEDPGRGDYVAGWDTPVNTNSTILDLVTGGAATISLNNSNVVLSAAQFRSKTLIFNSTLTGSVTITFPTSFVKSYEIQHICTGSSAFTITLATTVAGSQFIACPPGETVDITSDGSNLKFRNFGHVGEYWDYGGSSVPNWVSGCSVAPYLNCDGAVFSSATFPQLANALGTTTLPDSRGRTRYTLNQTSSRVTSSNSGINGSSRSASGGSEAMQLHNHGVTDPGHTHGHNLQATSPVNVNSGGGLVANQVPPAGATISAAGTGVTINNAGAGHSQNMPPAYIGGLSMIRSG